MPSSSVRTRTWQRSSVKPWQTGRMRSAWRRRRVARRRGRGRTGTRASLRLRSRRHPEPLCARSRCRSTRPRRRLGCIRRPRRRAVDRCGGGERPRLSEQRLARHLRRSRPAGRLPRREGADTAGDDRGGPRPESGRSRSAPRRRPRRRASSPGRGPRVEQPPTRSTAPSRPGRGRGSTAASSASSCSTTHAPGQILRPGSGVRRTSLWTRQDPCMPASTARRSNWTRRSSSRSGPARCASGSPPVIPASRRRDACRDVRGTPQETGASPSPSAAPSSREPPRTPLRTNPIALPTLAEWVS
jgi:hypothetical protein